MKQGQNGNFSILFLHVVADGCPARVGAPAGARLQPSISARGAPKHCDPGKGGGAPPGKGTMLWEGGNGFDGAPTRHDYFARVCARNAQKC